MSGTWNVLAIFGMAKFQTLEHRIRYHWQSRDRILLEVGTFTSRTAGSSDFYGRILHERPRISPSLQSSWLKLVRSRNFFQTGSVWETADPSDLFKVGYLTVVAEPPIIRRFGALDSPERVQTAMGHKCLDWQQQPGRSGWLLSRWWFPIFFMFTPTWGRFPIWLIFFKWVETNNQLFFAIFLLIFPPLKPVLVLFQPGAISAVW